jgi:methyltransferase
MIFFWWLVFFVIFQRLVELFIAKRNAAILFAKGAKETDSIGYRYIVAMHVCFFISLILENNLLSRTLNKYWYIFFGLFAAAQVLRYWSIISLGHFWNTRIIVLKGSGLVSKGPYKYLSHPNYIAVVTELAAIPLIFSCYITAIVFSILNLFVLRRRIRIEKEALNDLTPVP